MHCCICRCSPPYVSLGSLSIILELTDSAELLASRSRVPFLHQCQHHRTGWLPPEVLYQCYSSCFYACTANTLPMKPSPHWDLESGTCSLCGLLFWYMMVTFRVKVWTSGLKASSSFQWDSLVPFMWQMLFCVVRKIRQKKKQQSCKNAFRLVCWRRSRLQCGDYPMAECPGAGGVNLALPGDQIKKRI